jgi:predicted hydrocarbon binding protein
MASTGFDIYLSVESMEIMYISDPLQRSILGILYRHPSNMKDMIAELDVPQSTMSVTMTKLTDATLVKSIPDSTDSRKRIFILNAVYFASSRPLDLEKAMYLPVVFNDMAESKGNFKSILLSTMIVGVQTAGFDIEPWFRWIGYNIGLYMVDRSDAETVEQIIRSLMLYFEDNDLGSIQIETHLPLTLLIDSPQSIPGFVGGSKSAFIVGMLSSLTNEILKSKFDIDIVDSEEKDGHDIYRVIIEVGDGLPDCMDINLFFE